MFFERESAVNVYDCDCRNKLKMSAAMKYMQQASSDHLESLGMSGEKLYKENMVFLLSKSCIKVFDMPSSGQKFVIHTAPVKTKGARFVREFIMEDMSGSRLLSAVTLWILFNPASKKIIRPSSFPYELSLEKSLVSHDISDIDLTGYRTTEEQNRITRQIHYSDIDINQHVNNSIYADYICDSLPIDALSSGDFDTLAISFLSEARYGDSLSIGIAQTSDKSYYLSGVKQDSIVGFEAFLHLKPSPLVG